jgi:hypothetical protein
MSVFMLLGFNAFMALGCGIGLIQLLRPLSAATNDSYDARATSRAFESYGDIFVVAAVLGLLTGALFVAWLWRAHRQAGAARRYQPGWVVGGWLFPLVNLWLPPRLIHDVWVGSAPHRAIDRHRAGAIVTAWWLSLLSAIGLDQLFRASGAETLPDARFALTIGLTGAAVQALAATLCMAVVFHITRLQGPRR